MIPALNKQKFRQFHFSKNLCLSVKRFQTTNKAESYARQQKAQNHEFHNA